MPIKQQDTDKLNTLPADAFGGKQKPKKDKTDTAPAKDIHTNYGFSQKARQDTGRDVTDKQEYVEGGLQDTTKYTVDKR